MCRLASSRRSGAPSFRARARATRSAAASSAAKMFVNSSSNLSAQAGTEPPRGTSWTETRILPPLIELAIDLQEAFDVRLVQEDLSGMRTVGDLVQRILSRGPDPVVS